MTPIPHYVPPLWRSPGFWEEGKEGEEGGEGLKKGADSNSWKSKLFCDFVWLKNVLALVMAAEAEEAPEPTWF